MLAANPCRPEDGERVGGTVGFPRPGVRLRVADDADRERPAGEVGHVQVQGPSLFSGYWGRPERSAEAFTADGWYRTGDLFHTDADGYFYFTGRHGDMIKTAGANVAPREVEAAILDAAGLAAHVVGLDDPERGQVVAAAIRTRDPVDEDALHAALRERLSAYKVPKRYVFLADEDVPMLSSGKLDGRALKGMFSGA
jgi:acyl-CoA synthetase (AMP-forming)/AMP-acid ligase II